MCPTAPFAPEVTTRSAHGCLLAASVSPTCHSLATPCRRLSKSCKSPNAAEWHTCHRQNQTAEPDGCLTPSHTAPACCSPLARYRSVFMVLLRMSTHKYGIKPQCSPALIEMLSNLRYVLGQVARGCFPLPAVRHFTHALPPPPLALTVESPTTPLLLKGVQGRVHDRERLRGHHLRELALRHAKAVRHRGPVSVVSSCNLTHLRPESASAFFLPPAFPPISTADVMRGGVHAHAHRYGRANSDLVSKMVANIFKQQPKWGCFHHRHNWPDPCYLMPSHHLSPPDGEPIIAVLRYIEDLDSALETVVDMLGKARAKCINDDDDDAPAKLIQKQTNSNEQAEVSSSNISYTVAGSFELWPTPSSLSRCLRAVAASSAPSGGECCRLHHRHRGNVDGISRSTFGRRFGGPQVHLQSTTHPTHPCLLRSPSSCR